MKFQHLRCFIHVAEKGSMRAASEHLGLSATAVSLALRELERHTGAPLFSRQPQGVLLTYAGRRLLAHARLILAQVERAEEEIEQIQGLTGGAVTIGVTPWVSQTILPCALGDFQRMRADVRLDVAEAIGTSHEGLRDGSLDFTIGLSAPKALSASFVSRDLFKCGLAIVARIGHPLERATSLHELDGQNWVMTMREDMHEQRHSNMLKRYGVKLAANQVHYARSTLVSIAMMEGSDMLTVCPWPLVESPLMRSRMIALPIQDELPEMTTSLLMRRGDTPSTAAQLMIECFVEAARACQQSAEPSIRRMMSSVEFVEQD
ncbi:LysR family transcriptional regulator [Caballeronia fortuita]|uniref:LysR family transcriptional regulator n=1 Tax=Caballeronia fortuita TaxID=1777138 RepID=A0A158CQD3_9BURK|nr:LysR substrate-binding domain-containing protein [Caballeronia fortuita]SAK84574.1 LysR family transcriptional regulator [Caballeronia fortuita]